MACVEARGRQDHRAPRDPRRQLLGRSMLLFDGADRRQLGILLDS